jgi:hypothetical protein
MGSLGVDFLGFNVRRYHDGKLLIKPSMQAVRRLRERLAAEMRTLRGSNAAAVSTTACTVPRSRHRQRRRPTPPGHSRHSAADTPRNVAAAAAPDAHERSTTLARDRTRPAQRWSSRPRANQPIPSNRARRPRPMIDPSCGNWNRRPGTACAHNAHRTHGCVTRASNGR